MTKKASQPTHRIYAVTDNGPWTEIGAMWANKDGKGFNLKLDLIPINGANIVARVIEPKQSDEPAGAL